MIGILSDQAGLPKTLVLLLLAAVTVAALGGRATATTPADVPDSGLKVAGQPETATR